MDIRPDKNDTLSPERAADLLGVSARTVRRWIESGKLAGTQQPCATTRAAVDALRRRQQGLQGEVVPAADNGRGQNDRTGTAQAERQSGVLLYALREVERLALELGRREMEVEGLSREVGRLEAELAQAGLSRGQHGGAGHALSRFVPWLRVRG